MIIPQPKGVVGTLIGSLILFGLSILNVCLYTNNEMNSGLAMALGIFLGMVIATTLSSLFDKINPQYSVRAIITEDGNPLIQISVPGFVKGNKSAYEAAWTMIEEETESLVERGFVFLGETVTDNSSSQSACLFRSFETANGEQATSPLLSTSLINTSPHHPAPSQRRGGVKTF